MMMNGSFFRHLRRACAEPVFAVLWTSGRRVRRHSAAVLAALSAALLAPHLTTQAQNAAQQQAQAREAQARALLAKYTAAPGRDDSDGLLKEPAVRTELQRVVGNQLPKLMQNINVRGSIAFDGGSLGISGNAPHKGTEEEGVVCVNPFGPSLVEAAIFSKGKVTVFTTAEKYEYVTLCVKDWITQANSGHRDRFSQPKNVQVLRAK
jgi:hypothetical protein